jgi:hypothetical protein
MNYITIITIIVAIICLTELSAAKVLNVPRDYPDIKAAHDAASPGDTIRVGPGQYCGVELKKRLTLTGSGPSTVIKGCASSPTLGGGRVGFFLNGNRDGADGLSFPCAASGSTIEKFLFRGTTTAALDQDLVHGIFSRFCHHIQIRNIVITGTRQGITGTAAHHWDVRENRITGFNNVAAPGIGMQFSFNPFVTGGPTDSNNRPQHLNIHDNYVASHSGDRTFDLVGIDVRSGDHIQIIDNCVKITSDNPIDKFGIRVHHYFELSPTDLRDFSDAPSTHVKILNNNVKESVIGVFVTILDKDSAVINGNVGKHVIGATDVLLHDGVSWTGGRTYFDTNPGVERKEC